MGGFLWVMMRNTSNLGFWNWRIIRRPGPRDDVTMKYSLMLSFSPLVYHSYIDWMNVSDHY